MMNNLLVVYHKKTERKLEVAQETSLAVCSAESAVRQLKANLSKRDFSGELVEFIVTGNYPRDYILHTRFYLAKLKVHIGDKLYWLTLAVDREKKYLGPTQKNFLNTIIVYLGLQDTHSHNWLIQSLKF